MNDVHVGQVKWIGLTDDMVRVHIAMALGKIIFYFVAIVEGTGISWHDWKLFCLLLKGYFRTETVRISQKTCRWSRTKSILTGNLSLCDFPIQSRGKIFYVKRICRLSDTSKYGENIFVFFAQKKLLIGRQDIL